MQLISNQVIERNLAKNMEIGNRAYLYGETVFTTLRTVRGEPLFLERHRARLLEGSKYLWPWLKNLESEIDLRINAFFSSKSKNELRVRITVSVNQKAPTLSKEGGDLCIHIDSEEIPALEFHSKGIRLKTSLSRRSEGVLPAFLKKGNYLESIIERRNLKNFDEILFLTDNEEVAEASTSNLFILKNDQILTPPASSMVLEGTVRGVILELFENAQEKKIPYEDLLAAEAVWLTRSSVLIVPVFQVDHKSYSIHEIHRELFNKICKEVSND